MNKINLTEQQFFDYIKCPALYDMKYNKRIVLQDELFLINNLKSSARFFFLYILTKLKAPSFNVLSNKFEGLCREDMDLIDNKKYVDSLLKLQNFYNWACDKRIAVFDLDTKYTLPCDNAIFEGIMNPVAINEKKQIEFLDLNFSSRGTNQLEADNKLKYSIDMLTFNTIHEDQKAYGIRIHDVKLNKDTLAFREMEDYDRAVAAINNVATGIINKVFYPRESHMCTSCAYKNFCRGWR